MSAILAAMRHDMTMARFLAEVFSDLADTVHHTRLRAAGRVINATSNAAQAWRVAYFDAWMADLVPGLHPTWCAASRRWLWSTADHDPRPCGWPRPFKSSSKEQR